MQWAGWRWLASDDFSAPFVADEAAAIHFNGEVEPECFGRQKFRKFIRPFCDDHAVLLENFVPPEGDEFRR
jgi:hypothetical protein